MNRKEVEGHLSYVKGARETWGREHQDFFVNVDRIMRRLIHEAIANRMSAEEVAALSGVSVKHIRTLMRTYDLDPKGGKQLLSRKAAEALANNAELLGIEPREMDLMSPLAYLPAGSELRKAMAAERASQVHEVSGNAEPIVEFLPALREFVPTGTEDFDTCIVCRDGECGGACPEALYVVRQVMEALDSEDDRPWFRDYLDMSGSTQ